MGIADKLRKAAELFVELPPQAAPPPPSQYDAPASSDAEASPAAAAGSETASENDDIDRRIAQMNQTLQQMGGGGAAAAAAGTGGGQAKTVEQIVRDSEGPNLDEIAVSAQDSQAVLTADGSVDFPAIYAKAGLPAAPFTAEQTLEMLASLPANLPLEVKRQTVQVTIGAIGKSIGANPETIVADASRKLAALAAYAEGFTQHTSDFVGAAEFEIESLLAQVEEKRTAILAAKEQQTKIVQICDRETDRLDDILEFFSLDVGASKYAAVAAADAGTPPPLPPGA